MELGFSVNLVRVHDIIIFLIEGFLLKRLNFGWMINLKTTKE